MTTATFMFVPDIRCIKASLSPSWQERRKPRMIFMLRWESRYTYDTCRKRARYVAADHFREMLRQMDALAANEYDLPIIAGMSNIQLLRRYEGHEIGHPSIIRVEQGNVR